MAQLVHPICARSDAASIQLRSEAWRKGILILFDRAKKLALYQLSYAPALKILIEPDGHYGRWKTEDDLGRAGSG